MNRWWSWLASVAGAILGCVGLLSSQTPSIGEERAVSVHLRDGDERRLTVQELIRHGHALFVANWTDQDGGGRPLTTGAGQALSDPTRPLQGPRRFNRISGPDANACAGCHNVPFGIAGGGGDFATNVFVRAERFGFVTFDRRDATRGDAFDDTSRPLLLQTVGNARSTPGLFGAGYLELLARQITQDLQRIRDETAAGESRALTSKGLSFGVLSRRRDGVWDTTSVAGLPRASLVSEGPDRKPSLAIRPWHQSGTVVSLREVVNNAYNQHHGIQTTERFGEGTDPDGDGVVDELTAADVTGVTAFLAALPVPGRVIPNDPEVERAVFNGERLFDRIRCSACHVPSLPLDRNGWIYSEPNPYDGLARAELPETPLIDLLDGSLPRPRLARAQGRDVVYVPAYTDFKLHDITDPADATAKEPLDINEEVSSARFLAGNRRFLTKRLWGVGNEPPYFHHGLFTTLRRAILAHAGEALAQRQAFERLAHSEQDALIEFLKSLQVLPPGTRHLVVDERFQPKRWPPAH